MLFIFDMGGVVTSTFHLNDLYNEMGITKDCFFSICGHKSDSSEIDIWNMFQKGDIDSKEFWKLFNERGRGIISKPVKNDLFRLYFHPVLNSKTVELINALKENHRVVCGTNTCQSHWENHLERGDYAFFHQTYASNKIGEVKPDAAFFEIIMKAEGYKAENTFFVDDREENIESAKKLGINTVLFTSEQDLYDKWIKYR